MKVSSRFLASAAAVLLAVAAAPLQAATFNITPGDVNALKAAIQVSNSNAQDDIINLGAAGYLLSSVDNSSQDTGPNGLPVIMSDGGRTLTINGNGASLICVPGSTTPSIRHLQVGPNATVTLIATVFVNGRVVAPASGGAIYNDRGNLTLRNCTLENNEAVVFGSTTFGPALGGAIYNNRGTVTLRGCTLRDNRVEGSNEMHPSFPAENAQGGAIYNMGGTVTAQVCTFSANMGINASTSAFPAIISGGAIHNRASGSESASLVVSNSTFSGNRVSARPEARGGTIYNEGSNATTVLGNTILVGSDDILANNGGPITSSGYNLSNRFANGFLSATTDLTDTDPQLRALANNGGFTATHSLPVTSPAIDRGHRAAVPALEATTDQRGVARPYDHPAVAGVVGDGSDIGAFELVPSLLVTTTADHDDGACTPDDCTFREAITAANAGAGFDSISFAHGVTGTINLTSRLPQLSTPMEIAGPGANLLTIRRDTGGSYRLLFISNGTETGPQITLFGLTLANGQATGSGSAGGGIYNDFSTLRIDRCALLNNAADNGAGILNFRGIITALDSTFAGNAATIGFGGALFNNAAQGPASITLTNCTLSGNTAARGAAIYNGGSTGAARVTLLNCTTAANTSSFGSIYSTGATATTTLRNTLLSSPAGTPNLFVANSAVVTSQGNNLSSDSAGGTPPPDTSPGGLLNQSGDQRNTDPRLDPAGLQNNGGPTATVALLSDSKAINAANTAAAPAADQRRYPRVGVADIGAFEFGSAEPTPPPTPTPAPSVPPTPTPAPTATPTPAATPVPNRFANISTRLRVDTDDNVLIGGFIVTGSMQKRIIVRALGPSLPLDDKLQNPTLELYDGSGNLLAANDNWQDAPNRQEIIDSTIPPRDDLESAILQNVQLGAHTAVVSGVNGGTGVGLVEVYDLGNNQDSRLANISTRGRVLTGDNVMIGGLIASGSSPQKIILRAIGPSLEVPGRLEDPFLELYDGNGNLMTSNNNWKDTQQAEIEETGIPPSNDLESAIVTFLPPGDYTAVVRGVNDATGVAVVEVYALH